MLHQSRLLAMNPGCTACLGEISARESCRHHVNVRKRRQVPNVIVKLNTRELVQQDRLSWSSPLAKEFRCEASPVQTEFKTTNTGKKASY